MIAVCGYFRDSQTWNGVFINQVNKFFSFIRNQQNINKDDLEFFLLEGGSKDDTYKVLSEYGFASKLFSNKSIQIFQQEEENTNVASVVSEDRFKKLSKIGNKVLNAAKKSDNKYIFWMESDLIPPQNLLTELLSYTRENQWNKTLAIAPIPTFDWNGQHQFYDTWAFEGSKGEKWNNLDLFKLITYKDRLRPMNSIGSCALINAELLRKYDIDFGEGCFPELCKQGRQYGLNIYCDVGLKIAHPSNSYLNGRMI